MAVSAGQGCAGGAAVEPAVRRLRGVGPQLHPPRLQGARPLRHPPRLARRGGRKRGRRRRRRRKLLLHMSAGLSCQASWTVWTRFTVLALVVDPGIRSCRAGYAGIVPHAVFLFVVVRPKMLRIMAGPRCSASWPYWTRRTVMRFFQAVACTRLVLLVL